MFRAVLFDGGLLSVRDSLHFYYPLFDAIQQEWEAGRVPLWNPYSNCGEPLLASPTSSVFYPPRLLFFLPISYGARYHAYILMHLVLAGGACGWVARRWGASPVAAALAALSYACGGNVLFNYSNVVFLCGAAWLPLGLWSGARMVESRAWRDVPLFSIVLALMVLGGDPQLGYETGMLTALYAALLWCQERRPLRHLAALVGVSRPTGKPASEPLASSSMARWLHNRVLLLGGAAGLAGFLAAVQVLPTREANRFSIRAASEAPSTLLEVPGFLLGKRESLPRPDTGRPPHWYDALIGDPPPPAKHALDVYGHSFAPWRAIEFVWPNITGRFFPDDRRWGSILGWEPDVWVSSQYLGLWPFLLALAAWRVRRTDPRTRWLSLIALLSFLAAWGLYGPGWLMAAIRESAGERAGRAPVQLTGGVGGLYWLLTVLLPGFAGFRYPSKLLVLTSCSLSLLAARGLDALIGTHSRNSPDPPTADKSLRAGWWSSLFAVLAVVSTLLLAVTWLGGDAIRAFLDVRKPLRNVAFDSGGAVRDIQSAALHLLSLSCLALAGIWWMGRAQSRPPAENSRPMGGLQKWPWGLVLLTAVDLAVANSALIHTVDRAKWEEPPALARLVQRVEKERGSAARPVRIARAPHWIVPSSVPEHFSLTDRVDWQRRMMILRQNVPLQVGVVMSYGTLDHNEHEAWFDLMPVPDRIYLAPRRAYDAWGTEYFVVEETPQSANINLSTVGLRTSWAPAGSADSHPLFPLGPPLRRVDVPADRLPEGVRVLANDSAFPPAWIVHRVIPIRPIEPQERERWLPIMMQLVFPQSDAIDLRTTAVVEDRELAGDRPGQLRERAGGDVSSEACRIVSYAPDRVEIEATLKAEGIVVLSETYAPGWEAFVSTSGGAYRSAPVVRTNRTMRGVSVPAGEHRIRMVYRPSSFSIGAGLSATSWIGVLVAFGWRGRKGRQPIVP